MTSIDNSNSSNSNNNNSVALSLEHKLRATLNSYRQRRDEAHRGQQLAAERLRLVAEEWEIVQSSVLTAQKNLNTLQDKAGGSAAARQEHADRQRDVEHLTKEVRSSLVVAHCESFYFLQSSNRLDVCTVFLQVHFQHTELVQKRTKLDAQKDIAAKEGSQRHSAANSLQRLVQERRQRLHEIIINNTKSSSNTGAMIHSKPAPGYFELVLEGENLHGRWMDILGKRTAALERAASSLGVQVEQQQRIRAQYEKRLPHPTAKTANVDDTDDEVSVAQSL